MSNHLTSRIMYMDVSSLTDETIETLSNLDATMITEESSEDSSPTLSSGTLVTLVNTEGNSLTVSEETAAMILAASESESTGGSNGGSTENGGAANFSATVGSMTFGYVGGMTAAIGGANATIGGANATIGGTVAVGEPDLPEVAVVSVIDKYMLGTPLRKWKAVWAETGVILTSDQKDKHFIQDSELGLDFVMSLRPVSFKLRVESQGRRHYGFVAQELSPALKGRSFAGLVESEAGYGVIYTELIAPLVKAVQEQQKQIDDLKAQVRKLLG